MSEQESLQQRLKREMSEKLAKQTDDRVMLKVTPVKNSEYTDPTVKNVISDEQLKAVGLDLNDEQKKVVMGMMREHIMTTARATEIFNGQPTEEKVPTPSYTDEELKKWSIDYYLSILVHMEEEGSEPNIKLDDYIGDLENGFIRVGIDKPTYKDDVLANEILTEVIGMSRSPEKGSIADNFVEYVQNDRIEEHPSAYNYDREEWIEEVNNGIKQYADDLLYDSCVMWAKAVDYDRVMCEPIIKGRGQFFQQVEDLGYPYLCLLIKQAEK